MSEVKYPIAEMFYSVQGEGAQSGMPMAFLRLAGCNVGKPYTSQQRANMDLRIFQNECTIYDGRKFPCDTNYRMSTQMTVDEIVAEIKRLSLGCRWVSITGGEPLIHNLVPLVTRLKSEELLLHLETSGTIPFTDAVYEAIRRFDWIVVSPKHPFQSNYAYHAHEIRVLVDEDFKWETLPASVREPFDNREKIWISPVNDVGTINQENAQRCIALIDDHPGVRISLQIHKILNVR